MLKAVIVLATILLALGLWRFWPSAPAPEIAFEPQEVATAEAAAEDSPADDEPADIVVHVAGAVMRPGVFALAAGSRVTDAITAAGGGLGNAALDSLNLARILSDGEQVYVPSLEDIASGAQPPTASGGSGANSGGAVGGLIDINRATASELENLPGVGPATAQKIIDDREKNGPFSTPEDLMRVPGIGAKKFEAMKDLVTCG
jgi:competence protein ComEA